MIKQDYREDFSDKKKNLTNQEKETQKEPQSNELLNAMREFGVTKLPKITDNPRGNIQFLPIIGQIEGHSILGPSAKTTKYEHVIPHLIAVSQSNEVDGLLIILNTVGGDVEAGLAISELISNIGKPTVSLVLGGGHSIGVPIAVSADYSFIAKSATMTIHPVRYNGTTISAPQTFSYLESIQERIEDFIVRNSGITKAKLKKYMLDTSKLALDVGTILSGEEAVKSNLINEIGGLQDAVEKLFMMIEENKKSKK